VLEELQEGEVASALVGEVAGVVEASQEVEVVASLQEAEVVPEAAFLVDEVDRLPLCLCRYLGVFGVCNGNTGAVGYPGSIKGL
jgi:hypothetical protein